MQLMHVSLLTGVLQHGCGRLQAVPGVEGVEVEGGAAAEHLQPPETLQGAALLLLVPVARPPPRAQGPHTPLLQSVCRYINSCIQVASCAILLTLYILDLFLKCMCESSLQHEECVVSNSIWLMTCLREQHSNQILCHDIYNPFLP